MNRRRTELLVILAVTLLFWVLLQLRGDEEYFLGSTLLFLLALAVAIGYSRGISFGSLVVGIAAAGIGWVITGSLPAGLALGLISFIVSLLLCRLAREIGNPFYCF